LSPRERVDSLVRRSGGGRMQPSSHGRVAVIGMDEFEPPSTGQALRRVPEILDGPLIQVLQLTFRSTAPHQCGDRLGQEAELPLTLTNGCFRALLVLDVGVDAVPLNDV